MKRLIVLDLLLRSGSAVVPKTKASSQVVATPPPLSTGLDVRERAMLPLPPGKDF